MAHYMMMITGTLMNNNSCALLTNSLRPAFDSNSPFGYTINSSTLQYNFQVIDAMRLKERVVPKKDQTIK